MYHCNITVLQTVPVPVRTCINAILPYCIKFQSLYGHVAMQYFLNTNISSPCTDMKQCNITVLQKFQSLYGHEAMQYYRTANVPVTVQTRSNAILPYCKQFQSLYGHEAMQNYRTAKVPVPVRTWSNAILPYRKQFQSLYWHEVMQLYSTANTYSPCTDMKQCNITVLQTVPVPVRTWSNAIIPYCKQNTSLYGHEAMQYYRTAKGSSPCTDMKQCTITVLQTVPVPVRTWGNALLPYCKQFLSLYGHEAMQYYHTAISSIPCTDM